MAKKFCELVASYYCTNCLTNTSLGTCAHDFERNWYSNYIEHKSACTKYSMRGKKGKYGLFGRT